MLNISNQIYYKQSFLLPCKNNLKLHLLNKVAPAHCVSVLRNEDKPLMVVNAGEQVLVVDIIKESLIWSITNHEIVFGPNQVKISNTFQAQYIKQNMLENGHDPHQAQRISDVSGLNHPKQIVQLYFNTIQNVDLVSNLKSESVTDTSQIPPNNQNMHFYSNQTVQMSLIKIFKLMHFKQGQNGQEIEYIVLLNNGQMFQFSNKNNIQQSFYFNDELFALSSNLS